MGLSNHKEEQLRKMPIVEANVFKSKDGKYIVHKTVITDIKPMSYMEAVLENEPKADAEITEEAVA